MPALERPPKKPRVTLLIVTPVWGAYEVVSKCMQAIQQNTDQSYMHVLVNDNYKPSLTKIFGSPNKNQTFIDVNNDPPNSQHVEQIGKMMDLGLAWGKTALSWKYLVKLESDCIVNSGWDTVLTQELEKAEPCLGIEAYSVDTNQGDKIIEPDSKTYAKQWIEMNLTLFSSYAMNHIWSFSSWPHSIDQHLSRHLRTQSGDLEWYETTKTWITHYRSSSRRNYA